jgi:protease IV
MPPSAALYWLFQRSAAVAVRRGIGLVVGLLVVACVVSVAGMLAVYYIVSREPGVTRNSTLVLRLQGDLVESAPDDVFRQVLRGDQAHTVRAVVESLRKAKVDGRVGAVLIVPSGLQLPLWGKVQELREAILDFRRSGKPAIAYLEGADDRSYYLATACDRVYLMPSSQLDLNGLASYELFLGGTFEKIGAQPDFVRIGQYKTAPNTYTERTFTPAHREMSESLTRDMFIQLVRGIADGRKKTEADVAALIDQGPFLAEDALKAGLVDDLAYADQIDDKAQLPGGRLNELKAADYGRVSPTSLGLNRGPRIALIYAVGAIVSGESGFDPLFGQVVGSDTLIRYIKEARDDRSVRAIVVRVDSPGGSAVASDAIWRELVITRDQKPERPLVVSMSDLAASGGYYIAMAAPHIVAQPGTLTGSIGIFAGKLVTGGTYEKLGANVESVSIGKHAEIYTPERPFNESERAKVQAGIEDFYNRFVENAAASRHMSPAKLDSVAQGRVWTGQQAKQVGLVDALGGLDTALAAAKQRAGIDPDAEVEVVIYPPRRTVFELIARSLQSDTGPDALWPLLLRPAERRAAAIATAPLRMFRTGELLALLPYGIWAD